jgi:UDP-N-acetylmuramoyl-tripeptide--D-alanyl-D-alanine ligase
VTPPGPVLDASFVAGALGERLRQREGPDTTFTRAIIDSREAAPGDLFVALRGEHADGHDFASAAVSAGAAGCVLERPVEGTERAARFLVDDSLAGLQTLGARWRDALEGIEVVGVTGNVGKTTTKGMVAAVLRARYRTDATVNNYNNEIGVPLCLLELDPSTQRAVIEMGMYTTGEIALLCEWAQPRIGVVLNVGPVHLERAGSMAAIVAAKRELVEALPADGHAVLNIDDPDVAAMATATEARVWRFGLGEGADVRGTDVTAVGVDGFDLTITHGADSRRIRVPLPGAHLASNVLAAASVGLADGIPFADVCDALEALDVPLRTRLVNAGDGVRLIDDTYNANPASMRAALALLSELPGRHVALLGDMRELGSESDAAHEAAGREAADVLDVLLTIGELGAQIGAAASRAGLAAVVSYEDLDAALAGLEETVQPGDAVLIKGSRALGLEQLVADWLARRGVEEARP